MAKAREALQRAREVGAEPAAASAAAPASAAPADQPQSASEVSAARAAAQQTAASGGNADDITRAIREAIQADREAHAAKERARELEAQMQRQQQERDQRYKQDPVFRRMSEGASYEDVTREIVEGKLRPPSEVDQLREQLASMDRWRQDFERTQQLTAAQQRAKEALAASAEKYPWLGPLDWIPSTVAQLSMQRGGDIDSVLEQYNAAAEKDALALMRDPRALARALSNPEIRDSIAKALGALQSPPTEQKQTPAAPADRAVASTPPKTVTHRTAVEPQARTSRIASASERKAAASRILQAARKAAQG